MGRLYLVQVKSQAINKENKKAFLIPMELEFDDIRGVEEKVIHDALIRDAIKLYPQYTNIDDKPTFSIRKMTKGEYKKWMKTNVLEQKSYMKGA